MNGKAIFKHAARLIGPFLDQFFDTLGWQRGDLDVVVPHQASRHAVELLTGRLGFRDEQVVQNLALRGNCIAASLPLALAEAAEAGRIRPRRQGAAGRHRRGADAGRAGADLTE